MQRFDSDRSALDNKQMAIKILMNSLYGALANEHFRFYKYEHAASITLTGQFALRSIEKTIDEELNTLFKTEGEKYLIYIDTDSLYFTLDAAFKKYNITESAAIKTLEKLSQEKLAPIVNKICQACCDYMHSFENRLVFKTEIAADKGIWIGKKKYVLKAHSSEGVRFAKPKFKAKGLEMVRSSTPQFVRDKLKNALEIIFESDEAQTQAYIQGVKTEFLQLPHQAVAFPRGANNLAEYSSKTAIYTREKSVPIQVRAALLYNHYLKVYGVDNKYPAIGEGDKLKFLYLKMPNRLRENVIAFPADGELPAEFGVLDKVDYEAQFDKTFLSSIQIILTAISWQAEAKMDLSEFF